ncbi:hypothetical protein LCGC14_2129270 [marine sediment metagenome]|uniref:Uncharacterized protein n=1 Tax=marine sediment metagenome TaxID=412755 RepID=A0A0F9E1Z8_9ZZZZ
MVVVKKIFDVDSGGIGRPDYSPKVVTSATEDEQLNISVTATDSSDSFAQIVLAILIYNDGPNAVFYKRDAVATTSNYKMPAKTWASFDVPMTTPHFICASGETATVFAVGVF